MVETEEFGTVNAVLTVAITNGPSKHVSDDVKACNL